MNTNVQAFQAILDNGELFDRFLHGAASETVNLGGGVSIPTLASIVANFPVSNEQVQNIQAAIDALTAAIGVQPKVFATKALMDADLAYTADKIAYVYKDATAANNRFYIKLGASGAGSWDPSNDRFDIVAALVASENTRAVGRENEIEARNALFETLDPSLQFLEVDDDGLIIKEVSETDTVIVLDVFETLDPEVGSLDVSLDGYIIGEESPSGQVTSGALADLQDDIDGVDARVLNLEDEAQANLASDAFTARNIIMLVSGEVDEDQSPACYNCTVAVGVSSIIPNTPSGTVSLTGGSGSRATWSTTRNAAGAIVGVTDSGGSGGTVTLNSTTDVTPLTIGPASEIIVSCNGGAAAPTTFRVRLYTTVDMSEYYSCYADMSASSNPTPGAGLNIYRFNVTKHWRDRDHWRQVYAVRIDFTPTTAAQVFSDVLIGVHTPKQAQIIIVDDGGHDDAIDGSYQDMKARAWPMTWALIPELMGSSGYATLAKMQAVWAASSIDEMSIHSEAGENTSSTAVPVPDENQVLEYALRAKKFVEANFGVKLSWRAAWMYNRAVNPAKVRRYFRATAVTRSPDSGYDIWPPLDKWNIPRNGMHGMSLDAIAALYLDLEMCHATVVIYRHSDAELTSERWLAFRAAGDAAVAAGRVKFTTFGAAARELDAVSKTVWW